MKLYATATSERASKGQGGNTFLTIDLQAGAEREHIAKVELQPISDTRFRLSVFIRGVLKLDREIESGNKQQAI